MNYQVTVIYSDKKDRELLELVSIKFPIFLTFIDINTTSGRKEALRIKRHWGAKKDPFVVVEKEDKSVIRVLYSENSNAVVQLIQLLNDGQC